MNNAPHRRAYHAHERRLIELEREIRRLRAQLDGRGRREARTVPRGPVRVFEALADSASEYPAADTARDTFPARRMDLEFDTAETWNDGGTFTALATASGEKHHVLAPCYINSGERFLATFDDHAKRWFFLRGLWRERFVGLLAAGGLTSYYARDSISGAYSGSYPPTNTAAPAHWQESSQQWEALPDAPSYTVTNADGFPIPGGAVIRAWRDHWTGRYYAHQLHHPDDPASAQPYLQFFEDIHGFAGTTASQLWTPPSDPPALTLRAYARPWIADAVLPSPGPARWLTRGAYHFTGAVTVKNISTATPSDFRLYLDGLASPYQTHLTFDGAQLATNGAMQTQPVSCVAETAPGDWPTLAAALDGWIPSAGDEFAVGYSILCRPLHD